MIARIAAAEVPLVGGLDRMRVLKAIRIVVVFAVAACLTFYIAVQGTLMIGVHNNMSGNGGVIYFFLGCMLGLLGAPIAGGLAAVGVERLFKNWSSKRTAAR